MVDAITPWHGRQSRRLCRELETMSEQHPRMQLVRASDEIVGWQGSVDVDGTPHFVHLRYPWDFPERPPWLWETKPFKQDLVEYTHTGHQMREGDLCLYTHGHDERAWQAEYTAACMLDRYVEFRSGVDHDHGAFVRPAAGTAFLWHVQVWISPCLAQLMTVPGGRGSVSMRYTPNRRMAVVERVVVHGKDLELTDDLRMWQNPGLEATVHEGIWCRLDDPALLRDSDGHIRADWSEVQGLATASLPLGAAARLAERASFALLSSDRAGADQGIIAVKRPDAGAGTRLVCGARIGRLEEAIFARVEPVIGDRRSLRGKRALSIGLGSLGGRVALELAKAGVDRFLLYDPERLEAENICRHVGDLGELGNPKVEAVARAIERRNPGALVRGHIASPIGDGLFEGQEPFLDLVNALRSQDTLLVVTTADAQVEAAINRLAVHHDVPAVYASVLGDAEHGRVFRVIPGRTACCRCVLTSQEREPSRYRWFAGRAGGDRPGIGAYRQPGIPGISMDIEQIALSLWPAAPGSHQPRHRRWAARSVRILDVFTVVIEWRA